MEEEEEEGELAVDLESDSVVDVPFNARRISSSLTRAPHQLQGQPEAVVGSPQSMLLSRGQSLEDLVTYVYKIRSISCVDEEGLLL